MSRASEYAEMMKTKLNFTASEEEVARVSELGNLELSADEISPDSAIELANWIIATFGE